MFTGIIEDVGRIIGVSKEQSNLHFTVKSTLTRQLKIDQSIAHNGVCLTVVAIQKEANSYTVTAINETLENTNLGVLQLDDRINLERAMKLGDRLDGHLVQGHVDEIGKCVSIKNADGSWVFTFTYDDKKQNITIEKGSITVNGISLTVVDSKKNEFSVAIIPYTFEHTNFKQLQLNDTVNLEFDLIGKYVARITDLN